MLFVGPDTIHRNKLTFNSGFHGERHKNTRSKAHKCKNITFINRGRILPGQIEMKAVFRLAITKYDVGEEKSKQCYCTVPILAKTCHKSNVNKTISADVESISEATVHILHVYGSPILLRFKTSITSQILCRIMPSFTPECLFCQGTSNCIKFVIILVTSEIICEHVFFSDAISVTKLRN